MIVLLGHIFRIMEANITLKRDFSDVLFYRMFASCVHAILVNLFTLLNKKLVFDQILANLPFIATERSSFLKTLELCVFS